MSELDLRSAAKLIGIGTMTLTRIEKGREPSYQTLQAIIDWLSSPTGKDVK